MRTWALLVVGLLVCSCESSDKPQGYVFATSSCTILGGIVSVPPGYCVDYTGSSWFNNGGNQTANENCVIQGEACGQRCLVTFHSGASCAESNSNEGQEVGSCLVDGGKPTAQTYHYYLPTGGGAARAHCQTLAGVFTVG